MKMKGKYAASSRFPYLKYVKQSMLNITLSRMKACFLATILPVGRNLEVHINKKNFTQ